MATRAIKRKRDEGPLRRFPSLPERAPSILRQDQPTPGRVVALVGLLLVAMGALAMLAPSWRLGYFISPNWGMFFFLIGVGGLLYHAANETDQQFRRTYGALGFVLLWVGGVGSRFLPAGGVMGGYFLSYGVPSIGLALPFLLAFARHETDPIWRMRVINMIGLFGAVAALAGFVLGNMNPTYAPREALMWTIYILIGVVYLTSYISLEGGSSVRGYNAAIGMGAAGFAVFAVAFARSFIIGGAPYLVPDGLLLMSSGLLFAFISLCVCVDWPFIVLLRRELVGFFCSPVGYLVVLGFVLVGWYQFWSFVMFLRRETILQEPVIIRYFFDLSPVVFLVFAVPLLTMRLLSEEQRTGTWEVMLTAPVTESTVVLSKYFAALTLFMLGAATWAVNLIALRAMGQSAFEYRPVLSYFLTLFCTGAGFVGIGLFFSSVTRNQIISAVLTFAVMLLLTVLYVLIAHLSPPWSDLVRYIAYLELWYEAVQGVVSPRHLLLHLSIAVFFVFLTIKVLESRKWK